MTGDGYARYGVAPKVVTMVIMLVGATTLVVPHCVIYERRPSELWKNTQLRTLLALWTLGAVVLVVFESDGWPAVDVLFNWTSGLTTTGFAARPPTEGTESFVLWLMFAMLVGGCAGSTAGGIKIARVHRAVASLARRLVRIRKGRETTQPDEDEVAVVRAIRHSGLGQIVLVLGTWWIGALVLASTLPGDVPADEVLFESASAVGGVGLTTGLTSSALPTASKLVLTVLMWLGRLEIVPVLILVWRTGRVAVRTLRTGRGDQGEDDAEDEAVA